MRTVPIFATRNLAAIFIAAWTAASQPQIPLEQIRINSLSAISSNLEKYPQLVFDRGRVLRNCLKSSSRPLWC
jgi:hypothetical protein